MRFIVAAQMGIVRDRLSGNCLRTEASSTTTQLTDISLFLLANNSIKGKFNRFRLKACT
jgi:hypothetical protein